MVSQENIDNQHGSKEYRLIMGAIAFVGILIARYAFSKVAPRLTWIRGQMWGRIQTLITILVILLVLFFLVLIVINIAGKQEEWNEHKKKLDETPPSPELISVKKKESDLPPQSM